MNSLLADAFRSKCSTLKASCTSAMLQDSSSAQRPSRQQSARLPSPVAGPSSCGPTTMGNPQHMVPPIRSGYSTSGNFTSASTRLPIISNISLPVANLQAGGVIRAPAPHLQPYRP
uniref:Uncharacterized protein n=2 Tax=Cajanus cajan TaxID=3821 RepID=A0A151S5D2_CAJCA|nr:hypothetical protein KK1_028185 [Cajanus cajan]